VNAKERVKAALRFEETDIVPYDFEFVDGILEPLKAHFGVEDVYRHIGNHVFRFAVGGYARTGSETVVADDFGVVWNRDRAHQRIGGWGGIVRHALLEPTLQGYRFPDPHRPEIFEPVEGLISEHADQFIVAEVPGQFEQGWAMRGFEPLLLDLYDNPDFVRALFDGIVDYGLGLVDEYSRYQIDGVWCGDDWSHQQGLFMPPETWRRLVKPGLRRLYGAIRSKGLAVVVHCCGNCVELIPDLIELGVSMLNPVQPESMDVEKVKREFGKDIALYGAMGVQGVLPHGTPDEVRWVARERLRVLGKGGGYVFGSGSSVTADTPLENALACIEVATSQR
jgi:uroporphyrinogen decarboxylase